MTETISPVVTESCYDRLTVDVINTRKGSGIPQYIYICVDLLKGTSTNFAEHSHLRLV